MSAPQSTSTSARPSRPLLDAAAVELLDQLGAAVLVVDAHGRIRYRNATGGAWLPKGSELSSVCADLRILEPFDGWPVELGRVVESGASRPFEGALRRGDRTSASIVSIRCTPWLDGESKEPCGVAILIVEGPEPEAIEQRLEVSHRLASLGKLAARVAHELNNPLDGILRYVNLALRLVDEAPAPKLKTYLSESRTGLMRMVQIIGDLLEYSRSTEGGFDAMSVNEVVDQVVKSSASAAEGSGVVVAVDFQNANMPYVSGSRLYQVCSNLVKNAIDAMPSGGRLTITTGVADEQVVIRVADSGPGLPEPIERVFEPFYTTKPPGKGSGLGLAICKDFIEGLHGTITASNDADGGAVFTVRIPLSGFPPPPKMITLGGTGTACA